MMKVIHSDFDRALAELMWVTKKRIEKELPYQGRLLCLELIASTPPRWLQQGKKAIEKDLRKLLRPFGQSFIDHVGSEHGTTNINAYYHGEDERIRHYQFKRLDPTGAGIKAFHYANRGGRRMRVQGNARYRFFKGKNFQDITVQADYAVSREDFRSYMEKKWGDIGKLKSGWLESYEKLLALSPGGVKPDSWVRRHRVGALGRFENHIRDVNYKYLLLENNGNGINEAASNQMRSPVEWALRKRSVAIRNSIIEMFRKKQIKELGFK